MGALSPDELRIALAAGADVVAWREEFVARLRAGRRRPRQARHRHGPARHARSRRGHARRRGRRAARAAARGRDDPLRHRRRRPGVHGASSSRASCRGPTRSASCATPPTPPPRCASPAARLDMIRCGIAIYGMDPFHRDPAEHGLEPALELVSYVAEVKRARSGRERRATGGASSPSATPGSARSRSATATASGAGSPAASRCWSAAAASRWRRHGLDGQHHRRPRRRAGRARHRGGPARRARRRAHPRRGLGARARHDQLRGDLRAQPAGAAERTT